MSEFYNIPRLKFLSKSELDLGNNVLLYPPTLHGNLNYNTPKDVMINPEEKDEVEGEMDNLNNTDINEDEKEVIDNPYIDDYETNPSLFR